MNFIIKVNFQSLEQEYKIKQQMIDLDQMPADWQFAQNHAKAIKPGVTANASDHQKDSQYCPCCLKQIIKNEVPLCGNSKQLEFMGFGFPLYFIFLKYCIILLLILICSYSSMSLYWALAHNYKFCNTDSHRLLSATQAYCTSFMIRFARIQQTVSTDETILRISSFLMHLIALLYIRDHIQKTKEYYDQKTTTLSDYSLFFKNLPLKAGIQADINRFVNQNFSDDWDELKKIHSEREFQTQKKVIQVNLLPHTDNYYQLVKQKKHLIQQKRKIMKKLEQKRESSQKQYSIQRRPQLNLVKRKQTGSMEQDSSIQLTHKIQLSISIQKSCKLSKSLLQVNKQIQQKSLQIKKVCELYQQLNENDQLQSQLAIVVLNTEIFKNTILQFAEEGKMDKQIMQRYFGALNEDIIITEAPEPNEIIWQSVNYPMNKRLGRRVIGWILTIVFLALTTVVFYILLLLKTNNLLEALVQNDSQRYGIAVFLVFLALLLIVLFNKFVMGWVLHHFAHLQMHDNTFQEQFSFALKYTLGLFFTTALMTLAVQAITFHNFYAHQYGVIQQQSIMFFINAFFIPIIWLINPWQLLSLIKRKIFIGKQYMTQGQANEIMADCGYVMGKRYAEIIQTMWFTYLYSTLIPVGAFLTVIGLSLYYWTDKYNLLRRSSLKNNISGEMAIISLKLLDLTLFIKPMGELLFDFQIRDGVNVESIIFAIIGALYCLLPMDDILKFVHEEAFKQEEKSFEDVQHSFLETYKTLHPIFGHRKGMKIFGNLKQNTRRIEPYKLESSKLIVDKIYLKKHQLNNPSILLEDNSVNYSIPSNSLGVTLRIIPKQKDPLMKQFLINKQKVLTPSNLETSKENSSNIREGQPVHHNLIPNFPPHHKLEPIINDHKTAENNIRKRSGL